MNTKHELKNAYFAGLIDGEGTIAVFPNNKGTTMRPVVKINMTCKVTLEAVASHFGGKVIPHKTYNGNKPQWWWGLTYTKAIDVIKIIRPHLITKASAADAVLSFKPRPRGRPIKRKSALPP